MVNISGFSELILVGGQMCLFFAFLKYLLRVAERKLSRDSPIIKEDEFLKEYGYSWDYVFVFKVYDEDERDDMTSTQKEFTMKNVIDRIENAELETKCFYSVQKDEVYVKVRCPPSRLRAEASRINYKLLLDKNRLRVRARTGKKVEGGQAYIWRPINITDEFNTSPFSPYDYIFGPYINTAELAPLYAQYTVGDKAYPFQQLDRIKLILSIFERRVSDEVPGAGLNMAKMIAKSVTLGQFPVHNYDDLNRLQRKWLVLWQWPWNQPLDLIKDYFGQRIGFYFLYLQHYTTMLMGPALLGVIYDVLLAVYGNDGIYIVAVAQPIYLCLMLVWSTIYVELWKGKQSELGMRWGMHGYIQNEQDRPLYEGIDISSPIDGSKLRYFPASAVKYRKRVANTFIFFAVLIVLGVVGAIFAFQRWAEMEANMKYFTFGTFYMGSILVSAIFGVSINVLNVLYNGNAFALTEWQNHRTDTEFEDDLISKVFLFQLINSFAAVTYIAFIKGQVGECVGNDCLSEVSSNISIIFVTTLILRMVTEVPVSIYKQHQKVLADTEGVPPGTEQSPLEEQYSLRAYDSLLVTLQDYAAVVIQFGFTVLFVAAYPLAPTMALISAYILIRVDGWKLCQAYQRPEPKSVEDIGVWQDMLEILSYLAVMYNLGLVFFTSNVLAGYSTAVRWISYIALQNVLIYVKYVVSTVVEKMPEEVAIQLKRQAFLTNKVLFDMKDDDVEDVAVKGQKGPSNIIIEHTDYDWILPEKQEPTTTGKRAAAADTPSGMAQGKGKDQRSADATQITVTTDGDDDASDSE
jgi:hypothetical protein